MTQLTRAISPDVIASMLEGYEGLKYRPGTSKWVLCVEADFGSTVADNGSGQPDCGVSWNGTDLIVQTSIDRGRTWQTLGPAQAGFASRRIPGLNVGTVITNKLVYNRIFFPRPTSQLTSIYNFVRLENGDLFEATAANADLESPGAGAILTLGSHGVVRTGGRVRPQPELCYDLRSGDRSRLIRRVTTPLQSDGPKSGTHVSRGTVFKALGGEFENTYGEVQAQHETDPESPRFAKAAFTFECWIYYTDLPGGRDAICSWSTTAGNQIGDFEMNKNHDFGFMFYIEGNTIRANTARPWPQNAFGTREILVNEPRENWVGRWRHVAFAYDGLAAQIFIDGQLRGQRLWELDGGEPTAGIVIPTDGNFIVGNARSSFDRPLSAYVTEARLWNKAIQPERYWRRRLTATEAGELRTAGDLAACWPLKTNTVDIAGGNLHLFAFGGAVASSLNKPIYGLTPPRTSATPGDPPIRAPFWDLRMLDLRVDSNTLRICGGTSHITFPDGRTFTAAGDLLSVDGTLKENGQVDPDVGMTFALSGLDSQLRSIALNAVYQDRPIRLYLVTVSENGLILGGTDAAVWEGRMDQMVPVLRSEGSGADEKAVLTIGVRAETHLRDFDRTSPYKWNDEAHRAVYPDDYGFSEVAEVSERQELWPRPEDLSDTEDAP